MVGQPVGVAISKWGPPDQERTVAGRSFYRWYSTTGDCQWDIEVDPEDTIVGYRSSGIACSVIGDAK